MTDSFDTPEARLARRMFDSPSAKMARDLANSPSARLARELADSPETRLADAMPQCPEPVEVEQPAPRVEVKSGSPYLTVTIRAAD